jgi:amino-acid N-acetyltransferase
VVIDRFRRKGYGKMLTLKLIEYAREIKLKEVYLLTTTAKEFFEKLGFEEVNRDQVPSEVKNSNEFKYLCPSTAICMKFGIL